MSPLVIKNKGKIYEFKEPTIKVWSEVMALKEFLEEDELNIRMISMCLGMEREEIIECEAEKIIDIANRIQELFKQRNREFYAKVELNGKTFNLVDYTKIKFGQFVDIDTFLSKDESYKIKNLNELASYLFIEEGKEYSDIDFKRQAEEFQQLPVKYVDGAVFFLVNLGLTSHHLSQIYSGKKFLWWMTKTMIRSPRIGAGIQLFLSLLAMIYQSLKILLISPLFFVSTTWHFLKTKIKGKQKINLNNV